MTTQINLPATPPAWLKGHATARNAWRRCVLYEGSIPKRDLELLSGYVESLTKAISISAEIDDVGRKMDILIHRKATFFSKDELTSDLKRGLHNAQRVNDVFSHLRQLFLEFEKELLRSLDSTSPELRALILAIVPVGKSLLRKNESSRRSITNKTRGK